MAHVPEHQADVFISYCHDDSFAWIERFKRDLEARLNSKLRARNKVEIFFDTEDLRAGRVFDEQIPECLSKTGFFVAIVSIRFNGSEYCRHKELARFLRHKPVSEGRVIQVKHDLSADLPLEDSLAVDFANQAGPFVTGTPEYEQALRKVAEPIVLELDRLYAQSKVVFLAWSDDEGLERERKRLQSEIEARGLRIFPQPVAEFEPDIRLRDALQKSVTSVHFLQAQSNEFEERQLRIAREIGKPGVVASLASGETRLGAAGSPPPIWLGQGNPTISVANVIDVLVGRGKRDEPNPGTALGKTGLFFVFKPDSDSSLGLKLRQRIVNKGAFDVVVPPFQSATNDRYDSLNRSRAAILCGGKADPSWFRHEFDALSEAIVMRELYELRRALYQPPGGASNGFELGEKDSILHSERDLDAFLATLR